MEALVANKTYYMDLDQLLAVVTDVCQIYDQGEMTAMLNFYHDLGVIVKHGRTVVLQAQWLIDLFKQLITVRPFHEAVSCSCHWHFLSSFSNLHTVFWMRIIESLPLIIAANLAAGQPAKKKLKRKQFSLQLL